MAKMDDWKTDLGKKVWEESFGAYFKKEIPAKPKEEIKPETQPNHESSNQSSINSAPTTPYISSTQPARPISLEDRFSEPQVPQTIEQTVQTPRINDPFAEPQISSSQQTHPQVFSEPAPQLQQPAFISNSTLETSLTVSEPYEQGDNIFRELSTYYLANQVYGKDAKFVLMEDSNSLLATVSAASGLSVMIGGRSRSGKSLILDKLADILTSTYQVDVASNKSFFKNYESINGHDFLYITEYQAAIKENRAAEEALKKLTENKDASNNANPSEVINGCLTILTTGADENKDIRNMNVEVTGRFIRLKTSSSKEKTDAIVKYQDELDAGIRKEVLFSQQRYDKLKQHIANVVQDEKSTFEDPFALTFYSEHLPNTQKSVYYRTLYKSMVKSVARFDKPNRVTEGDKIFTSIFDVYLLNEHYHKTYCDSLRELTEQSYKSLINSTQDQAENTRLQAEYQSEISEIEGKRDKTLTRDDWQKVWDSAYKHMEDNHPDLLNPWVKLQSRDGKVIVYDPVIKQDVYLCDVKPPITSGPGAQTPVGLAKINSMPEGYPLDV